MTRLLGAARPTRITRGQPVSAQEQGKTRLLQAKTFGGEYLTTFAPNTLPLTSFFSSNLFEIARNNAAAAVLALTAAKHTADLAVSEGHLHDGLYSRLAWRQIAQWSFASIDGATIGTAPDECYDAMRLSSASDVRMLWSRFWASPVDMARVIPRVRVSNDNSATNTTTLTLEFYESSDLMTVFASRVISFSTATARNRQWLEGAPIDLSGGPTDGDQGRRILFLVSVVGVQGAANEPVALHEVQLGVLQ